MPTASNLRQTYSLANLVTASGLDIRYSLEKIGGYWQAVRNARKSYSYVGMSLAAARSCLAAKRAQYYRDTVSLEEVVNEQTGAVTVNEFKNWRCGASISLRHGDGDLWSVEITVDETDYRYAGTSKPADPAVLFASTLTLDSLLPNYDEGPGVDVFYIRSAARNAPASASATETTLALDVALGSPIMPVVDPSTVFVEIKTSETAVAWTHRGYLSDPSIVVPATGDLFVRLSYDSEYYPYKSNVIHIS